MAAISIERVSKRYGPVAAVHDLSLEVRDREFVTLLGPSGCGKTTLLRLVAGFVTPDEGVIRVDGLTVSSADAVVPPERRGMGMVFQNYAICRTRPCTRTSPSAWRSGGSPGTPRASASRAC
jgi:iron(III) transport system ATP-binding protein